MVEAGWTNLQTGPAFMLLTISAPLPLILIGIFCTVEAVLNATRAMSDKPIHYALSLPFVK